MVSKVRMMFPQNWPGPIKVPFPVQCAAKLAKLFEDLNQAGHRKLKTHPSLETCVSLSLLLSLITYDACGINRPFHSMHD